MAIKTLTDQDQVTPTKIPENKKILGNDMADVLSRREFFKNFSDQPKACFWITKTLFIGKMKVFGRLCDGFYLLQPYPSEDTLITAPVAYHLKIPYRLANHVYSFHFWLELLCCHLYHDQLNWIAMLDFSEVKISPLLLLLFQ